MKDRISVIVPVYNVPYDMLRKCLNSLKKQSYSNLEVIVVDDGSTDDSSKIVDEYCNYKNFKVLHKKNGGLCDARNFGQKIATGDWICFVDGDDNLESDIFEKVSLNILSNTEIVCFGTTKSYKNRKFKYDYNNAFQEDKLYTDNFELLSKLLDFDNNIGDVTGKLYKREFLNANNLFHDASVRQGVEAIDYNYRCFEITKGFQFINTYGYNYEFNDNSITLRIDKKSMEYLFIGIEKLYNNVKNSNDERLVNILNKRINVVVVTTLISGIFSTNNRLTKKEKSYLIHEIKNNIYIKNALKNISELDIKRKTILFLFKIRFYLLIRIIAYIRKMQKENI